MGDDGDEEVVFIKVERTATGCYWVKQEVIYSRSFLVTALADEPITHEPCAASKCLMIRAGDPKTTEFAGMLRTTTEFTPITQ
jgi:hypothetical protein